MFADILLCVYVCVFMIVVLCLVFALSLCVEFMQRNYKLESMLEVYVIIMCGRLIATCG